MAIIVAGSVREFVNHVLFPENVLIMITQKYVS